MKRSKYKESRDNHTSFIKHSTKGDVTTLLVYVDNIIVTGNDLVERKRLKFALARQFEKKDLKMLKNFVGIGAAYSKEGVFLSQKNYIINLLKDTYTLGSNL